MKELVWLVAVILAARLIALAAAPLGMTMHQNEWMAKQAAIQKLIDKLAEESPVSAQSQGFVQSEAVELTSYSGRGANQEEKSK